MLQQEPLSYVMILFKLGAELLGDLILPLCFLYLFIFDRIDVGLLRTLKHSTKGPRREPKLEVHEGHVVSTNWALALFIFNFTSSCSNITSAISYERQYTWLDEEFSMSLVVDYTQEVVMSKIK